MALTDLTISLTTQQEDGGTKFVITDGSNYGIATGEITDLTLITVSIQKINIKTDDDPDDPIEITIGNGLDIDFDFSGAVAADMEFEITGELLGYGDDAIIPDDIYTIIYTVTDGTDEKAKTFSELLFAIVECGVEKMLVKVAQEHTPLLCTDSFVRAAENADIMLQSLKMCGLYNERTAIAKSLKDLERILLINECNC